MNNKFSLSFGISLIIVGFLNIFFDTSNIIIFGLSISTLLFSIINMIVPRFNNNKLEMIYIIPFVLLVSVFCYSGSLMKIDIIRDIVNGRINNILTFVSFGLLFLSEYLNYQYQKEKDKIFDTIQATNEIEYSSLILMLITKYIHNITEKHISIDDESMNFLNQIDELCTEKATLATIDGALVELNKDSYTIQDFNDAYKAHRDSINYEKLIEEHNKIFSDDNEKSNKKKK